MKIKVLSVFEVNNYIKKILDNDFILNNLSVKGEISNLKYHSSGHIYFSLKDDHSKINCVMFKNDAYNLDFVMEDGMSVIVKARASVYSANGSMQLYCSEIQNSGLGDLYIKYQILKEKLEKEGLFNIMEKKPIPDDVKRIGVITSETGAVIHDIINVTKSRNKTIDIVLFPAKVQGDGAYLSLIDGLNYFNKNKSVDLIIIGRGGGSMEELWNFNEEDLARAIFDSKIPVISAVGHETDITIADFVSDVRAATPSQAAEIAVKDSKDLKDKAENLKTLLIKSMDSIITSKKSLLEIATHRLNINSPEYKISNEMIEIDRLKEKLNSNIESKLFEFRSDLKIMIGKLDGLSPLKILDRGYSVIKKENKIVSSKKELLKAGEIEIILKDGSIIGEFKSKE
ncbi:exodeoxyribonuclease VII large subunit [Clostridium chrysemydis]|uniref:exodeoxyribonuclease VII large subunit n=1 Tax=Clostridium chrysemydis TaxID=2665504 RepID=UPI0018836609|nr:exodeoxyribonuclease VII large subunit [Clostridium chrysemydis]